MKFPNYDCQKVGFVKFGDNSDQDIYHDEALKKADNRKYKPPKNLSSIPSNTLFISNLNRKTTENTVVKEFQKYGKIISSKLIKDIVTNESKGYCFLQFKHFSDCKRAFYKTQGIIFENQKIVVDYERGRQQKNWKPRRMGGGIGGRKKSGQMRFSQTLKK